MGYSVLLAFAVMDDENQGVETDILYRQAQAFEQPMPVAVKQSGRQIIRGAKIVQDGIVFLPGQDYRGIWLPFEPGHILKLFKMWNHAA